MLTVTRVSQYLWGMDDNKMTVSAAAKALGVSRSHVYRLIDRGELSPHRNPLYRKHAPVSLSRAQVDALVRRMQDENGWGREQGDEEERRLAARAS